MDTNLDSGIAIRCEGLTRYYGDVKALDHLDLVVPTGSIFGFLGRNGAGKTTTMRLITGMANPTAGRAWIAGVETTNGDPSAGYAYGYLPQQPVFFGWMRAWEYLDYVGRLYKMPDKLRKQRTFEVLEQVGLKDAAKRKIAGFSGGMKQRLGIAQAILHQPRVLLLDEPTSALDPAGRYEVLDWIRNLNGQTTVFLSSHILDDIERICDQVAILHNGRLVKVGERDAILAEYATNAVEIQVEPGAEIALDTFVQQLAAQPWVESSILERRLARIMVSDMAAGQEYLLPMLAEAGLPLARFEWVRPTLEEVFLELSE
ncbi:MAG: ABC transporter ATP-binding protein [Chloroflexi bacterium HGW-Chloroflexi-10]|nr:MAG: ABC transporter ATP-binding protein [Chloroflexi bacterium HGW-Chloroflexi-10]